MLTDAALPLLRRTPLLPGESLPSLVERLTQLNHYAGAAILTQLCQAQQASPWRQDKAGCPLYGATFLGLAYLTQLHVAELIAASAHSFTPALAPSGAVPTTADWLTAPNQPRPLPVQARRYLRPTTAAQYCPRCLQQARYHRRSWLPAPVTVCQEHYCLLIDHCPGCQRPIAVADIVYGRCPTCRADLSAAPGVSVTEDNLGLQAQNLILAWFGLEPVPPWDTARHCPAPTLALRVRLMEHLCRRLLSCRKAWARWPTPLPNPNGEAMHISARTYRLTAHDTYYLYRAAFAALLDWPQGFYRYLDAYSRWRQPDALPARCTRQLHTLQKDWLTPAWRADDNDLCIETFVDYLLDRRLPLAGSLVNQLKDVTWFVDKTGLWTEARVAQALGVPQQTLGRFYPYGLLADCYCHLDRAGAPYFDRAKVLAVCQRWQAAQGWSLAGASDWLGLPESTVLLLVARGLLTPMAGSAEPPRCTFDRQMVIDFFDRVAACAVFPEKSVSGLLRLNEAVRHISHFPADPATLLNAALEGRLSAYRRHPELTALSHVCFSVDEVFRQGNTLPSPLAG